MRSDHDGAGGAMMFVMGAFLSAVLGFWSEVQWLRGALGPRSSTVRLAKSLKCLLTVLEFLFVF
jgi:hypothetical protein